MRHKLNELERLINVLNSVGKVHDYATVRQEASWLRYYAFSNEPSPIERQRGIVKKLEELPSILERLRDRARKEEKKATYERLLAAVNESLPKLIDLWRYWDKSKEELYSMFQDVSYWNRTARIWEMRPDDRARPLLIFNTLSEIIDQSLAPGRFEAKVEALLPKRKITPKDYEELLKEFQDSMAEWAGIPMTPENRASMEELLLPAQEHIANLYVLSILDF